jgi:hypothetical protein
MEIRSYRRVFDLERRIYRVDRLRLNPAGIPVRGAVYFLAIAAMTATVSRLPLVSLLARALPWFVRDIALPAASAALLTVIRVEGRPFHLAAHALARYRVAPRHLIGTRSCRASSSLYPGGRWRPKEILQLPDGSDCRFRRLRYTGPGAVLVTVAHERSSSRFRALRTVGRRPDLTLRELSCADRPAHGEVIVLERAARLEVR